MAVGGAVSVAVTLNGVYNALRVDFRQDSLLTAAYCLLPILCSPVFLLVRPVGRASLALTVMAIGFLATNAALNWRTCAELGYCISVTATVLKTLKTHLALAFFAVAAISLIAERVDERRKGADRKLKVKS
jgi:hypothetical protein